MDTLVLFCKTYRGDIERFRILKNSIDKFNAYNIPFYVVCPQSDKTMFEEIATKNESYSYNIITDEELLQMNQNEYHEQNWYSQQIIKLSFYRSGVCQHYLCLDSDCYFIQNFYIDDFIYDNKTPYLPLTEPMKGAEINFIQLFRELESKEEEASWNTVSKKYFNRTGKRFCLNVPPVLSAKVLDHMEKYFLIPNNLTFKHLISISPYEYEWYCDYLLKYKPINFIVCMPFFVSFYNNTFYQIYRILGFTEKILSHYYKGIIMHEGYVKDKVYKNSFWGTIIRKVIQISFYANKEKIINKKFSFKEKYKRFRYKYFKYPYKVIIAKK